VDGPTAWVKKRGYHHLTINYNLLQNGTKHFDFFLLSNQRQEHRMSVSDSKVLTEVERERKIILLHYKQGSDGRAMYVGMLINL
jgi:hypothetical protein